METKQNIWEIIGVYFYQFGKRRPVFAKTTASKTQKDAVLNSVEAVYVGRGGRLHHP